MNRRPPSLWRSLAVAALLALPGMRASDSVSSPKLLLLDAAFGGGAVVAVGEHGAIFRSSDNARSWQSVGPTGVTATLTAISFSPVFTPSMVRGAPDFILGWAVGHDAIILFTNDGGKTWAKQFQGENPNDPFLDVLALDMKHAIAVGAYASFYETTDGGKTWLRRKLGDDDFHLNRITRGPSGTLYLAGEHGTLLRSADTGKTWSPIRTPYEGSFYGVLPLGPRSLVAYGLRGHVYRSEDDGTTWTAVATPEPALLATALRTKNGTLILAGQARTVISGHDGDRAFVAVPNAPTTAIAELLELPDGHILAVGEAGATLLEVGRVTPDAPSQELRSNSDRATTPLAPPPAR